MENNKIKLWEHQQKLVDKNPEKHLLAFECGTGKTLTALCLSKSYQTLVVCPKGIKTQWQEQTDNDVLTKEEFKKQWKTLPKYECLIVDEAHNFSGMQGVRKMSGMLKSMLLYIKKHNPPRRYLLTATPYMSTPWNIFALAKILGREWDAKAFKERYFSMVNMGMRYPIPVVKKGIEDEMALLVSRLGTVVKMENCFDIPEQIYQTEYYELTKEQKKAIEDLDEEGIARWTRVHQICGGTMKSDGYDEDAFYKSNKLNRLLELVQEHKKLIVVCRYNNEIEYLKSRIKNKTIFTINGSTKDKNNVVKKAESNDNCIVFVQAAASEGYELPSFPVMVFYSYDFSLKNYIQMKGRILRANKLKKNVYLSLVVKNTIDDDVYKCIQAKSDFDVAIYNK